MYLSRTVAAPNPPMLIFPDPPGPRDDELDWNPEVSATTMSATLVATNPNPRWVLAYREEGDEGSNWFPAHFIPPFSAKIKGPVEAAIDATQGMFKAIDAAIARRFGGKTKASQAFLDELQSGTGPGEAALRLSDLTRRTRLRTYTVGISTESFNDRDAAAFLSTYLTELVLPVFGVLSDADIVGEFPALAETAIDCLTNTQEERALVLSAWREIKSGAVNNGLSSATKAMNELFDKSIACTTETMEQLAEQILDEGIEEAAEKFGGALVKVADSLSIVGLAVDIHNAGSGLKSLVDMATGKGSRGEYQFAFRYFSGCAERFQTEEECNGLDDDCDGQTDESPLDLGGPCTVGTGACRREGAMVCGAGVSTCNAQAGSPSTEACSGGVDEDCDGLVDCDDVDCTHACLMPIADAGVDTPTHDSDVGPPSDLNPPDAGAGTGPDVAPDVSSVDSPSDLPADFAPATCGNGLCDTGETASTCFADCGWTRVLESTSSISLAGNGTTIAGDGAIYVTGNYSGSVDFDPGPGADSRESAFAGDVFVSKFLPDGMRAWTLPIDGTGYDVSFATAITPDDGIVITGTFNTSCLDFDPGPGQSTLCTLRSNNNDVFVARIAADRGVVWRVAFGSGAEGDEGRAVAVGPDGGTYLAGIFGGSADFDAGPGVEMKVCSGVKCGFVTKLGADGSHIWTATFGGAWPNAAWAQTVAVDAAGVLVAGYFVGAVDFDAGPSVDTRTPPGAGYSAFATRLGADGSYHWTRTLGGSANVMASGAALGVGGEIYLTGTLEGPTDFDPGPGTAMFSTSGGPDAYVTRLEADGSYGGWTWTAGAEQDDYGQSVTVDGNVLLVTGRFKGMVDFDPGAGVDSRGSAGNFDAFVTRLGTTGSYAWTRAWGGTGPDQGFGLALRAGVTAVAGSFYGTVDFYSGGASDSRTVPAQGVFLSRWRE